MIEALLHGKLSREQENMEDILTSNVFGMLQYVAPELGLFRFLAHAKTIDGQCPLKMLGVLGPGACVQYDFWPNWPRSEPDVVLDIRFGELAYMVGVEAKYRSGKSSEADELEGRPNDQLAREWIDLAAEAVRRGTQPVLVYLTADVGCPKSQILDSLNELNRKTSTEASQAEICWLTWRELPQLFRDTTNTSMLRAIATMAEDRMGLIFFQGIKDIGTVRADWRFRQSKSAWHFSMASIGLEWRFVQ